MANKVIKFPIISPPRVDIDFPVRIPFSTNDCLFVVLENDKVVETFNVMLDAQTLINKLLDAGHNNLAMACVDEETVFKWRK
jgi:hypothetical protein